MFVRQIIKDPKLKNGIPTEMQWQKRMMLPSRIVIHHSAGYDWAENKAETVLGFLNDIAKNQWMEWAGHNQTYHVNLKNNPTFINYHFVVWPGKNRWNMVQTVKYPLSEILWHAGNAKINRESLGVCIMGNYLHKEVDPKAIKKIANYIRWLVFYLKMHDVKVKITGHRDYINNPDRNACPCNVYDKLSELRRMLKC